MPAGDNEKLFEELMRSKFGSSCLKGKRVFNLKLQGHDRVTISVDQSITLEDGTVVLIEIDSANMAKLVAGQYALINGMYDKERNKAIFFVVHYFHNYNPERTLKNLKAIQHFNQEVDWIPFAACHIDEFREMLKNVSDLEELGACIKGLTN